MSENESTNHSISAGMYVFPNMNQGLFLTMCLDEIALYDRQIRLWGVKAQEKYVF